MQDFVAAGDQKESELCPDLRVIASEPATLILKCYQ